MRRKLLILAAAALVVPLAPAALAGHGQIEDGRLYSYPFQAIQDTRFGFDWVGVGGGGNPGFSSLQGDENLGSTPDDCFDADNYPGQTFLKVAYPSVSVQTSFEEQTIVPGQSTEAPAEVTFACTVARELLFGQEAGYAYDNDPQQIGFGDFTGRIEAVVSSAGYFDFDAAGEDPGATGLVGVPTTLVVQYCTADFVDTASTGNEAWAENGLNNGELIVSGTPVCDDLSGDYLAHLEDNPSAQWDVGTFNRIGGGNVYRQSVADDADGLKIVCVNFSINDANSNGAGFFEDYSYFFIDNVDGNVVTDFWTDPLEHSDGGALAQDCSSLGIAV